MSASWWSTHPNKRRGLVHTSDQNIFLHNCTRSMISLTIISCWLLLRPRWPWWCRADSAADAHRALVQPSGVAPLLSLQCTPVGRDCHPWGGAGGPGSCERWPWHGRGNWEGKFVQNKRYPRIILTSIIINEAFKLLNGNIWYHIRTFCPLAQWSWRSGSPRKSCLGWAELRCPCHAHIQP